MMKELCRRPLGKSSWKKKRKRKQRNKPNTPRDQEKKRRPKIVSNNIIEKKKMARSSKSIHVMCAFIFPCLDIIIVLTAAAAAALPAVKMMLMERRRQMTLLPAAAAVETHDSLLQAHRHCLPLLHLLLHRLLRACCRKQCSPPHCNRSRQPRLRASPDRRPRADGSDP